jgi:hypothetical protein
MESFPKVVQHHLYVKEMSPPKLHVESPRISELYIPQQSSPWKCPVKCLESVMHKLKCDARYRKWVWFSLKNASAEDAQSGGFWGICRRITARISVSLMEQRNHQVKPTPKLETVLSPVPVLNVTLSRHPGSVPNLNK